MQSNNLFSWQVNNIEESNSSHSGMSKSETIEDSSHFFIQRNEDAKLSTLLCPWCKHEILIDFYTYIHDGHNHNIKCFCMFCGWGSKFTFDTDYISFAYKRSQTLSIKNFENPDYVSIQKEVENHIIKKDSSPYKFEGLMGSLFENMGYKVEYTKKSRDGGKDFILYVNGERYAIVEVKRWKDKVGVDLIRQLRGVQFEDNV